MHYSVQNALWKKGRREGGVGEWGSEEERKNGKEGREKESGGEEEQRMRREGGPNVAVPCRK